MGEIKFRAWDKQNKCWYEPIHEAYAGRLWELLLSFSGELQGWTLRGSEAGLVHESTFPDRYQLMQYTGFKDIDGKEIYEGDIVGHYIKLTPDGPQNYESFRSLIEWWPNMVSVQKARVIGNIYENPELLKGDEA